MAADSVVVPLTQISLARFAIANTDRISEIEIVAENGVLSLVFAKATGELRALHNSKAGLSANLTERAMVWSSKGSDNYKFEPAALPNSTGQSSVSVEAGAIATSVVKHSSSTTGVGEHCNTKTCY